MQTTRIFKSGNSLAVRLPVGFQLRGDRVEIFRHGNEIVLREIPQNLGEAFALLQQLPDDFFEDGKKDTPPQQMNFT